MEQLPIIINGETLGQLTIRREGAYVICRGHAQWSEEGLLRLWLYGSGEPVYLGVLQPDGTVRLNTIDRLPYDLFLGIYFLLGFLQVGGLVELSYAGWEGGTLALCIICVLLDLPLVILLFTGTATRCDMLPVALRRLAVVVAADEFA